MLIIRYGTVLHTRYSNIFCDLNVGTEEKSDIFFFPRELEG